MLGLSISLLQSIGKHPGCNDVGKSSPPPAPDYTGAAKATAAGNLEAAQATIEANRVNQYTPYGSSTWSHTPTFDQAGYDKAMSDYQASLNTSRGGFLGNQIPAPVMPDKNSFYDNNAGWAQTINLSPEQQQLLNKQNQTSLGLADTLGQGVSYVQDMLNKPFDTSQLPAMPVTGDNAGRDATTNAIIARLQPQFDQQRQAAESNLLARGFNPGTEAFKNAQDAQARAENDAKLAAVQAGNQEQATLFGLGSQARNQALQEQSFLRNEPLNTLNAVRTGAQVTGPQFNNVPMQQGVAGPDLLGAANATGQYNQGVYNAQQAGQSNLTSGLFGLGGAALMSPIGTFAALSDIRLKKNIKRIGTHALGIGWYIWDYLWGEKGIGVIAQELLPVKPEAVLTHPSGYLMVDYARI